MRRECEVEGCTEDARWPIYRTLDGKREWIYVCNLHEKAIGNENLRRVGVPMHWRKKKLATRKP